MQKPTFKQSMGWKKTWFDEIFSLGVGLIPAKPLSLSLSI